MLCDYFSNNTPIDKGNKVLVKTITLLEDICNPHYSAMHNSQFLSYHLPTFANTMTVI
jgi:hypothetical protein